MSYLRRNSAVFSGSDTSYEFIQRENGNWVTGRVSIDALCSQEVRTTDIIVVFLPEFSELVSLNLDERLVDCFRVPTAFWSTQVQEASGYFGCQDSRDTNGDLDRVRSLLRFLVKLPTTPFSCTNPAYNTTSNYVWHHLGVYIDWNPFRHATVLCFGVPSSLRSSLSSLSGLHIDDPFSFHTIFVEKVIRLYDTAVWSWRDRIREIEQNRTSPDNPQPDYIAMHEIARHIIHNSEVLAMAIETVTSLVQEHDFFFEENVPLTTELLAQSKRSRRALRTQIVLFKCFHLRSKALEERLRNEINLAFNTVAQRDSRVAVQIGKAAQVDSESMRVISVLGLVFLPGTFICALFSTSFFNFSPASHTEPQMWTVSEKFWIYWVVAVPITIVTVASWAFWQRCLVRRPAHY